MFAFDAGDSRFDSGDSRDANLGPHRGRQVDLQFAPGGCSQRFAGHYQNDPITMVLPISKNIGDDGHRELGLQADNPEPPSPITLKGHYVSQFMFKEYQPTQQQIETSDRSLHLAVFLSFMAAVDRHGGLAIEF
jgi:hypothetical protein